MIELEKEKNTSVDPMVLSNPIENRESRDNVNTISSQPQVKYISEQLTIGGLGVKAKSMPGIEFAKPFQFLNLGVLAYIGASTALAQINIGTPLQSRLNP